jgi:hypothetical protein
VSESYVFLSLSMMIFFIFCLVIFEHVIELAPSTSPFTPQSVSGVSGHHTSHTLNISHLLSRHLISICVFPSGYMSPLNTYMFHAVFFFPHPSVSHAERSYNAFSIICVTTFMQLTRYPALLNSVPLEKLIVTGQVKNVSVCYRI